MSIKINDASDRIIVAKMATMKNEDIERIVLKRLKEQPNPKAYYQAMYKAFWQYPRIQNAFESAYQKYLEEV